MSGPFRNFDRGERPGGPNRSRQELALGGIGVSITPSLPVLPLIVLPSIVNENGTRQWFAVIRQHDPKHGGHCFPFAATDKKHVYKRKNAPFVRENYHRKKGGALDPALEPVPCFGLHLFVELVGDVEEVAALPVRGAGLLKTVSDLCERGVHPCVREERIA